MANATILIDHVGDVNRVTGFAMTAAEVRVAGSVWSLDTHNEAVDVQNDSVAVELCSLRVLQCDGQLLQLSVNRQLDEAAGTINYVIVYIPCLT